MDQESDLDSVSSNFQLNKSLEGGASRNNNIKRNTIDAKIMV